VSAAGVVTVHNSSYVPQLCTNVYQDTESTWGIETCAPTARFAHSCNNSSLEPWKYYIFATFSDFHGSTTLLVHLV